MSFSRATRCYYMVTVLLWLLFVAVDAQFSNHRFTNDSFLPTLGPIDDAKCNIEDLERANDSQLHSILEELASTAFFRTFRSDLNRKCPLRSWRGRVGEDEDEQEEFECDGGGDELDEDAPPLCHVAGEDDMNPFGTSSLESNALQHLSQGGFESKAQQNTFAWRQHSDRVVSEDADAECESDLGDAFWMDMCAAINSDDGEFVNLLLNPERNTGYNGTHIWKAIYEENCIAMDEESTDMCLEERVLYRLLSGLHTSTTISIAKHYYPPSKRKGRTDWEPNPDYFMSKFENHPEYIRNLHFSFIVLLRALQKASPFLYQYEIRTGDIVQDEAATILLKRLLDSSILSSCSSVFSAFDESVMFAETSRAVSLQQNFKGVFHNVSSILDCVQCQQCKLHGKLAMLGYGAALKVLFMSHVQLERNEIVAMINTLTKFSESLVHVRELTHLYWAAQTGMSTSAVPVAVSGATVTVEAVDRAVELAARLGRDGRIGVDREAELVQLALERQPELLILAKHYAGDIDKFLQFSAGLGALGGASTLPPDAVIVGSGLAGLSAALNILDRGGHVVIVEKEHLVGGNSNKASSGINACCPSEGDDLEVFRNDTLRSAGESARPELIDTLVNRSENAVKWLQTRVKVDLSLLAQLGGHSAKRTHRPNNGMAGAEIIYAIQKAVREYEKTGQVEFLLDTRVTGLVTDDTGRVTGVKYASADGSEAELLADNVILATGGFAADRSVGSFLEKYRPELLKMPTTAGHFSTGDGVSLATALGAGTVDMDKVQVHPTGWVDPADPDNTSKVLAAELMRGVGGILLNDEGKRFCNELGTRAYVTDRMLSHDADYAKTGQWDVKSTVPTFHLVLSSSAAEDGKKHVDLYSHKGLMTRVEGLTALAKHTGVSKSVLSATLKQYQQDAAKGQDEFGKTSFRGVPMQDLESETFFVGKVTPVLHYCMGGITIDKEGNVLKENGEIIGGLHAAGEVTGGVHGVNRLAGNSLLECTVYGTIVGQKIPVKASSRALLSPLSQNAKPASKKELRPVAITELQKHNTPEDCWVAIHGIVYDLTEFAEEHPAGPQSIHELAGKDGTAAFAAVHNERIMEDFEDERIGLLQV